MNTNRSRPASGRGQRLVVPVVYVSAMFMSILDTTIVTVALPTIGHDLQAPASDVGLVSIAYLVGLTVFIPASGWLGDRIGGRRALLGAIGLFTLASILCGAATTLGELVAFRFVQGIGGAVMVPVGLSMLFRVYPPAERVRISAVVAAVTALAPALGPVLGGLFTTDLTWRAVFFVNMPIGLAAFAFGALRLAPHSQPDPGRLDVPGLVLSCLGLGSTIYGVSQGPSLGWSSPPVMITLLVGSALLAALIAVELHADRPLIDLRLLGDRLLGPCTGLYALGSVSYLGTLYLAALFFQDARGLSALQSGLTTFPSALGVLAGGQLVTRFLYPRLGPRPPAALGLLLIAAATALTARLGLGTSLWSARLIMLGLGIGVSFVFIPAQAASMATVTKAATGRASALFNAGKQLGSAVGVALLGTVLGALGPTRDHAGHAVPNPTAYHVGFLVAAAVAALSVPLALRIRTADAAPTMSRPRPAALRPSDAAHRRADPA